MFERCWNGILHRLLGRKYVARRVVKSFARFHSWSYKYLSYAAVHAEENKLHPKHRITKYHDFFVHNVKNTDVVLDVGCGNGALTADLAKKAKKVIGIDLNAKNIADAKKFYSKENITFINGNICTMDLGQFRKCDVVVLSNILEHIEERKSFLEAINRISPKVLIRVPQYDRAWEVAYKKELGIEWRLDPTHETEYTQEQLEQELKAVELSVKSVVCKFGEFWVVAEKKGDHGN